MDVIEELDSLLLGSKKPSWANRARDEIISLREQLEQLRTKLSVADDGLIAVNDLIDDSTGVAGLHLNGDVAPWDQLRTGGCFEEWLCMFDVAVAAAISRIPPAPREAGTDPFKHQYLQGQGNSPQPSQKMFGHACRKADRHMVETPGRQELITKAVQHLRSEPAHKFFGAGEIDCPKEIKAGNGELHTLRCRICGQDNPRSAVCYGDATTPHPDDAGKVAVAVAWQWRLKDSGHPWYSCSKEFFVDHDSRYEVRELFLGPTTPPATGEPVAEIVNKFGDPEAFAERELRTLVDIQKLKIGTKLFAAPSAREAQQ